MFLKSSDSMSSLDHSWTSEDAGMTGAEVVFLGSGDCEIQLGGEIETSNNVFEALQIMVLSSL